MRFGSAKGFSLCYAAGRSSLLPVVTPETPRLPGGAFSVGIGSGKPNAGTFPRRRKRPESPSSCSAVLSFPQLCRGVYATRERRALLTLDVLAAHAFAGFARGELFVVGSLCHRGDALAERRAFLAGDMFFALICAVDTVGFCLFRQRRVGSRALGGWRVLRAVALTVALAGVRGLARQSRHRRRRKG